MLLLRWWRASRLAFPLALLVAFAPLAQATPSPAEHALISSLIQRVEKMSTLTFLRNGTPHTAAEAAQHMEAKYAHFKDRITTAEDFIERCASRSEMTGQPYLVRIGEGAPRDAGAFLKETLSALRQSPR